MYPQALTLVSGITERVIYYRRGELINGKKHGYWIEYDSDGFPWQETIKMDLKDGSWIFTNSDNSQYQLISVLEKLFWNAKKNRLLDM